MQSKFPSNKERWLIRLRAFGDISVILLFLLGAIPLAFLDPAMLVTMLHWVLFGVLFMAVSILLSRIAFPSLSLSHWLQEAKENNLPAAVVCAAVILFLGMTFLGVTLWARG